MRKFWSLLAATAALLCLSLQLATAGLLGSPLVLKSVADRIRFDAPHVATMGHSQFRQRYAEACQFRMMFRDGPVKLTAERG